MSERMKGKSIMKRRVYIIAILSVIAVTASAQTFGTSHKPMQREAEAVTVQSQQIMQTNTYNGTVYEPFSTTAPSEYHPVAGDQESGGRPHGHIRRGFDVGGETGRSEEFPIGDAVLPLMLCALAFSFVIARRRKRAE